MRQARFLAPGAVAGRRSGIYHCVSRVVDRQFVLGRAEKEEFVRLMRLYEKFCGVRVLSFCVMTNHFHLLLEVPLRPKDGLSDKELLRRLALLYSDAFVGEIRAQLRRARKAGDEEEVAGIKERFLYRMWDLSQFMKTLKQRFTQWFNGRHNRKGTLWEERFKSVIVEDGYASRVMAAYIDLNPVRAGMVAKPEAYRWCGCAEAVAGRRAARAGITRVMEQLRELGAGRPEVRSWRQIIASYREILYADGAERRYEDERTGKVTVTRRGIRHGEPNAEPNAASASAPQTAGLLSTTQMLRHRIRHFVEGTVIGGESFVEEVFEAARERFGPRRPNGARKIRGTRTPLRSLRNLSGAIE